MVSDSLKLQSRLAEVERYFTKKEYRKFVVEATVLFQMGQFEECQKRLDKLPSNGDLLERLIEKLKGKSVHKTLMQIQEGKVCNNLVTAKGLSSLLTHILIECEHGNDEYKILLLNVAEKLNEIIYGTLR